MSDAPEVAFHNLIRDNWDASNTSGLGVSEGTIDCHHGWVDLGGENPEVTISNPNEFQRGGGETGYSGLASDGSPVQNFGGTVNVNVWTDRHRSSVNPRKLAFEMKEEVHRIVRANYDPRPTYDLWPLAVMGSNRFVEADSDPTMWRYQLTCGYGRRVD